MRLNGTLAAIIGYFLWGVLPIYWKQIAHIPATEILAHRIVWSLLFVALVLASRRHWQWLGETLRDRRIIFASLLSAAIIGANWFIYIWAVNNDYIVEASLGYFINPLFNVVFGVLFFREHLRPLQWLAVLLAFTGVIYLTIDYGRLPWVALGLATMFGIYGILRKIARLDASEGLFVEMIYLFLPGLIYLLLLNANGQSHFLHSGTRTDFFLLGAGAATMLPLLFFTYAARRIRLSQLGLLQYLAPTLQFLIGVFLYKEAFTSSHLIGFAIIWLALLIYSTDLLRAIVSPKKGAL
jgi:chloramphenicol-sensitive protein RarD